MPVFHIVTDSGAAFAKADWLQQYPITVVPYKLTINGTTYRDTVDLAPEDAIQLMAESAQPASVKAPSIEEYAAVYTHLSHTADGIISLHTSRDLTASWDNARKAAAQVNDGTPITVIDSRTICAAQGLLVHATAQAATQTSDYAHLIQQARDAVDRLYSIYYVETLTFLQHNGLLSASRAILGTMLGIKPVLSTEDGQLIVIEKVKTQSQALEKLIEFIIEFDDLADAAIVQPNRSPTESTRALQDRLAAEYPDATIPMTVYSSILAALIGPQAYGVVVLEKHQIGTE